MKSLQAGGLTFGFDDKTLNRNGFLNDNPQKAITILRHQRAVQKAIELIGTRIQNPPTLVELASATRLSRTYFSHVFKEVTGINLQDYLAQVRLEKAQELLNHIDLKIKEIAHKAGFSDPNYFCRTFKKKMGLNPTNWRLGNILSFQTDDSRKKVAFRRM